jgi:hypothetical protein
MRRFDRRRLRIPRPPPGDRILVWFRLPLLLLVAVTGYGVVGYRVLEGWSLLDALCMTVITLATVGFHESKPVAAPTPRPQQLNPVSEVRERFRIFIPNRVDLAR